MLSRLCVQESSSCAARGWRGASAGTHSSLRFSLGKIPWRVTCVLLAMVLESVSRVCPLGSTSAEGILACVPSASDVGSHLFKSPASQCQACHGDDIMALVLL